MDVGTVRPTSARASSTVLSCMLGSPAMALGKGWYVRATRAIASFIPAPPPPITDMQQTY